MKAAAQERDFEVQYVDEWGHQQTYRAKRVRTRSAATFKLFVLYHEAYGRNFREFLENCRPRPRRSP